MLVTSHSDEDTNLLLDFLSKRGVRLSRSEDLRFVARQSDRTGELIGVVAYLGFNGATCTIACAGDGNWLSKSYLEAIFAYPFITCKLAYMFAFVAENNPRSWRLVRHIGFEHLDVIKQGWDERTGLFVMGLSRDRCRWLDSPKPVIYTKQLELALET